MYCVKCGVELADTEDKCPLCGTAVFHPDIKRPEAEPQYPPYRPKKAETVSRAGMLFVITMLFLLPMVTLLICDLEISGGGFSWSGYPIGALLLLYVLAVLPLWFKRPNPVIFVPVNFAAIALYLLYIAFETGGSWYLSFALPITAAAALIVTAVVTLVKYLRRGYLYIFGGAMILIGMFSVLVEFLLNLTFHTSEAVLWSLFPLAACSILGLMLIVIGFCRPLRESLHRKFFL